MPKLSVIVPVFNTEQYLDTCVKSLLNQNQKDIEIILVNDGSTDNSPSICDSYHRADSRVYVIHQKNSGVSAARNAGIDVAKGDWITFVDSDDWVDPTMANVSQSCSDDIDIHAFGFYKEYVNKSVPYRLCTDDITFLPCDVKKNYLHNSALRFGVYSLSCGKIYRRTFLLEKDIRFPPEVPIGEDQIFLLYAFYHANKVRLDNELFYHYRMVASSAVNKWNPARPQQFAIQLQKYDEFVDMYFTGTENVHMKSTKRINMLMDLAHHYHDADMPIRDKVKQMRKHMHEEEYKTAVNTTPIDLIPRKRRLQIQLLRRSHVCIWFCLFSFTIWLKSCVIKTRLDAVSIAQK